MDDIILEEIAQLVKEGFTSGILDGQGMKRVSWSIDIEEVE